MIRKCYRYPAIRAAWTHHHGSNRRTGNLRVVRNQICTVLSPKSCPENKINFKNKCMMKRGYQQVYHAERSESTTVIFGFGLRFFLIFNRLLKIILFFFVLEGNRLPNMDSSRS